MFSSLFTSHKHQEIAIIHIIIKPIDCPNKTPFAQYKTLQMYTKGIVKTVAFKKFIIVEFFANQILLNVAFAIKTRAWNMKIQDKKVKKSVASSFDSKLRLKISIIKFCVKNKTKDTENI